MAWVDIVLNMQQRGPPVHSAPMRMRRYDSPIWAIRNATKN